MGAAILKLDRDQKSQKFTSMHPDDLKYVQRIQKHVNKCEQRDIPGHNATALLKYVMNDIRPYQFEPEGTWQEKDNSTWLRC